MTSKSPVSIGLVGAAGRMGLEIARAADGRNDIRIGAALERGDSPHLGRDIGALAGLNAADVIVGADAGQFFDCIDVAIDLSSPEALESVVEGARRHKIPLVCGTTGIGDTALQCLKEASSDIPVLYTPNLSLGIAVTKKLVEQAVRDLGPNYDVEIVEMHHGQKIDSPSGTAMALAEAVACCRGVSLKDESVFGRQGRTGKRKGSEIGIHALRGGGVFGWHKVIFAGQHETIEISHRASTRALFAEGALRAALFLNEKKAGWYEMTDILREQP